MPRLLIILLWIILLFLPAIIISLLPPSKKQKFFQLVHKTLCKILRIKVKRSGEISNDIPILFVSNHLSYLDIMVLGSALPGNFVSKAEVAKWPIIGWGAKLSGTIFINRKRSEAGGHLSSLTNALDEKRNLILFPEGTTGNGTHILPFKSSLFKLAEDRDITIQPVTLKYSTVNGLPIQNQEKAKVSWVGDEGFTPHFKDFIKLGRIGVEVIVHPPIEKSNDRKAIAAECYKAVSSV